MIDSFHFYTNSDMTSALCLISIQSKNQPSWQPFLVWLWTRCEVSGKQEGGGWNFIPKSVLKMAAMANRKKGDYSVLSEINTEEEWLNLLERKVSSIKISYVIRYFLKLQW